MTHTMCRGWIPGLMMWYIMIVGVGKEGIIGTLNYIIISLVHTCWRLSNKLCSRLDAPEVSTAFNSQPSQGVRELGSWGVRSLGW